jgi:hypothetical protein
MLEILDVPELVCIIVNSKEEMLKNQALDRLLAHPNFISDCLKYIIYRTRPEPLVIDNKKEDYPEDTSPIFNNRLHTELRQLKGVTADDLFFSMVNSYNVRSRENAQLLLLNHPNIAESHLLDMYGDYRCDRVSYLIEQALLDRRDISTETLYIASFALKEPINITAPIRKLNGRNDARLSFLKPNLETDSRAVIENKYRAMLNHPLSSTTQLIEIAAQRYLENIAVEARLLLRQPYHKFVLSLLFPHSAKLTSEDPQNFEIADLQIPELCCLVIANLDGVSEKALNVLFTRISGSVEMSLTELNRSEILCHILDNLRPVSFPQNQTPELFIKVARAIVDTKSATADQLYFAMLHTQDETHLYIQEALINHPDVKPYMLDEIVRHYDNDLNLMSQAITLFLNHPETSEYQLRMAVSDRGYYLNDRTATILACCRHPDAILDELSHLHMIAETEAEHRAIDKRILNHKYASTDNLKNLVESCKFPDLANLANAKLSQPEHQFVMSLLPEI